MFDTTDSYAINQHLYSERVLYDLDLRNADAFAPDPAISWAGAGETYLQRAVGHWGDDRTRRDKVMRWPRDLSGRGLP